MGRAIAKNSMVTPDGTELVSRTRHHCVTHTDGVDGKWYMVDGGEEYIRRSLCGEDTSVYYDEGHDKVRENLSWGTYGKEGLSDLKYVLLKDMSTDHILNVLEFCFISEERTKAMEVELERRETT